MNEFELLTLFNEYFDATFARLNDFMAGTFAMLVCAYFAAAKMTRKLAGVVVFLYTVFAIATFVPVVMASYRFAKSGELLKIASAQPDSAITQLFPTFPSAVMVVPTMSVLLFGSFVGTLAFFFFARSTTIEPTDQAG